MTIARRLILLLAVPLLVLSGLALLLFASGSAGYFVRRSQGRNTPPPGT